MNTGIILTIVGGLLAVLAYLFAPFITLVEDGVTVYAWQVATGQGGLLLSLLAVALAGWTARSRKQAAGWGMAALALGQLALLGLTYAHVWALVPARALGLPADGQTGALVDGTLVMLDWGFALAAGQAAGALFAGLLVVAAHREFAKSQRFLKLAVQWGGQTVFERVLFDAAPVTVGEEDDALVQLAAGGLARHLLLQPIGPERYAIHVPVFIKGQLHLHGERVDAPGQSAELGPGDAGILWFDNDVSLVFGFTGAESTSLAAGLGRDPGMAVSMAATTAVTLVLLLVMLAGQKHSHPADAQESLDEKHVASIAFTIAEPPKPADAPPEPDKTNENAPPAPIGPPLDHRAPKAGLADRDMKLETKVPKPDHPTGPVDLKTVGMVKAMLDAADVGAMKKIMEGRGERDWESPMAAQTDGLDDGAQIGGGNRLTVWKKGGIGGGGESPWDLVGLPHGTDPNGHDLRHTLPIGRKIARKVPPYKFAEGTTIGGCDKGDIAKQVRARGSIVRACYETQLLSAPTLQGKLTAQWTIGGDGSVQGEKAVNDTLNSNAVGDCVMRAIHRIRFQAPEAGTCVIQWPFVFSPG